MAGSRSRSRDIKIIGAAWGIGARDSGCAGAPEHLRAAGLERMLRGSGGRTVWQETIAAPSVASAQAITHWQPASPLSALTELSERLAASVEAIVREGDLPVVIGGDHTCAIGTWSGAARALGATGPIGLIWIDAHLDSHTLHSTPSNALHGMPLAALLGEEPALAGGASLAPQHVCIVGARDFESDEAALLMRLGVRVFGMREVQRRGLDAVMHDALELVQDGTAGFGITIDMDAIDPRDAPGVGSPVVDGIRASELCAALHALAQDPALLAIEIAEFNPQRDQHGQTERCVAALLEALLGAAAPAAPFIEWERRYGAHNYAPLPVVLTRGRGAYLWDTDGKRYLDMMSAYSAVSLGHAHPRMVRALREQARRLSVTSRAFYTDRLPLLLQRLCELTGFDQALPMNTGMEAVETAIKAARKWAYRVKGVPADRAEVIVCNGNFHGRSITIVGFSAEAQYRDGFGPFATGFKRIAYGDAAALAAAITPHTAAFLVEPVQGEGGIIVPPRGYLAECARICRAHNVLLLCDEIQTGLGRTGKLLACEHEQVEPDGVMLGKALGGGVLPVSAFLARREVMQVFTPGDHGSTFGGNALAATVALEALNVIIDERLCERAAELGAYLLHELRGVRSALIRDVRGIGLFVGVDVDPAQVSARRVCEALLQHGILSKDTHETVVRFAPPLIIERAQLDQAIAAVRSVFAQLEQELQRGGQPAAVHSIAL
jgi:ornithine--oxo-acid transaminase